MSSKKKKSKREHLLDVYDGLSGFFELLWSFFWNSPFSTFSLWLFGAKMIIDMYELGDINGLFLWYTFVFTGCMLLTAYQCGKLRAWVMEK